MVHLPSLQNMRDAAERIRGKALRTPLLRSEPLSELTGLVELSIGYNELSSLSWVSELTALEWLSLRENQITDLAPLASLPVLKNLYVYDNPLSDLGPLAGISTLEVFWAQDDQIVELTPLSGLTALSWVNLVRNQIVDISPLVANAGLGEDDQVSLNENPLDCDEQMGNVEILRQRGVAVGVSCD